MEIKDMEIKDDVLLSYIMDLQRMNSTLNDIIGDYTLNNQCKIMILKNEITNMHQYVHHVSNQILKTIAV